MARVAGKGGRAVVEGGEGALGRIPDSGGGGGTASRPANWRGSGGASTDEACGGGATPGQGPFSGSWRTAGGPGTACMGIVPPLPLGSPGIAGTVGAR